MIVPEYQHIKSEGFKDTLKDGSTVKGRGSQQIRWEMNYLDAIDVASVYYDLRFANPEVPDASSPASRGNIGPTVRPEAGWIASQVEHGKFDAVFYTPDGSVGTDWVKEHMYRLHNQKAAPEARQRLQQEKTPTNLEGYYSNNIDQFIDELVGKIQQVFLKRANLAESVKSAEPRRLATLPQIFDLYNSENLITDQIIQNLVPLREELLSLMLNLNPPLSPAIWTKIVEQYALQGGRPSLEALRKIFNSDRIQIPRADLERIQQKASAEYDRLYVLNEVSPFERVGRLSDEDEAALTNYFGQISGFLTEVTKKCDVFFQKKAE